MSSVERLLLSLEGLSVGDAFGERMFFATVHDDAFLPSGPWRWTDDTHMALSVVEVLTQHGRIDQDALAAAFARRFREDRGRGYGGGAFRLLSALVGGEDWRVAAPALFEGGSYGNGAAMRVAPVGAWFAADLERAASESRRSAEITHAHPEGQAGAIAVAVAAALAAGSQRLTAADFLGRVLSHVPGGHVRDGIERACAIPAESLWKAVEDLGVGEKVSAQDTVPFCLWAAVHHLDSYEDALRWTARGGGDVDTTCAIVGGIVALSARKVPAEWRTRREPLPPEFTLSGFRA